MESVSAFKVVLFPQLRKIHKQWDYPSYKIVMDATVYINSNIFV